MSSLTIDLCVTACQAGPYTLAGVEYGRECWCGSFFADGGTIAPSTECNTQCVGNKTEFCGGPEKLSVYNFNNTLNGTTSTSSAPGPSDTPTGPSAIPIVGSYVYYGCQTEATVGRALISNSTSSDSMTLEYCETWCIGYPLFGTEYGRECKCQHIP
jgi:hypothetical protein